MEMLALITGTVTTFLIVLTVYAKNIRSLTNKLFVGMSISLIGWSLTTYYSLHTLSDAQTLSWMRPIMFFVVLQNTFFFLMVRVFPVSQSNLLRSKRYVAAVIYSFLTAITALTPLLFADFKDGAPIPGPGMALFIPHALIFAVGGIVLLVKKFISATGIEKAQLQYFLAGTVLLYTLVPVGNFIIPVVFKTNIFVTLSPLYSIIFSGLFAYGIVAKRLFDVRTAVVRSVAYILSLGFIGLFYGLVIYTVFALLGFDYLSLATERALFIGFAILTATAFPYSKRFFDNLTTKLFFQDTYDPQVFLDDLNDVLVVNIELDKLVKETITVIEKNMKADFCVFSIRETSYYPRRIIGDSEKLFSEKDIEELGEVSAHLHEKVILTDDIESDDNELKRVLQKNDVAILVRLVSTLDYEVQGVGYIMFGAKKSGNPYNHQDIQALDIIGNELVIAIQNGLRFEEIEKFNATLQDKIDDATRQLRKSNDKLKQMDENKDEFISMASHQLRTPLTSVKGYLSMVLEGDAGETTEMQHKLLDQAFISSQRMVYLIADLLNVSRLRTGKFIIETVPTNLADLVDGELKQLQGTAKSHNLELTFKKPDKFPSLLLDETKIRQVVMNFTDNAIYYTPSGGHIQVEVEEKPKSVEFRVVDDGLGVPKDEQHHLFTKFYRAGNAKKARPDGTGLGLFMAKKVIIAQGGAIIFKSEEGKGSTFGFSFDKEKLLAPTTPEKPSEKQDEKPK